MQKWGKMSQDKHCRRLCTTRWWAKDQAVRKVFGCFGNPQGALFLEVLMTLHTVVDDRTQQPTVRAKAKGFTEGVLRHETECSLHKCSFAFLSRHPLSQNTFRQGEWMSSQHHVWARGQRRVSGSVL